MDNFKKGGSIGRRSGGGFSGDRGDKRSFGGGRKKERPEMFSTVCSDCGKGCEVPFRPTGNKPVFCSDCFRNKSVSRSQDSRGGRKDFKSRFEDRKTYQNNGDKGALNYKPQFEALNFKLDKILQLLKLKNEEVGEDTVTEIKKTKKLLKKEVSLPDLKKAIKKTTAKKLTTKKKK